MHMREDYTPVFEGHNIAVCPGMVDNQLVAAEKSNLFAENELLKDYIDNIACIIECQMPLKEQDLWVDDVVEMGWYKRTED